MEYVLVIMLLAFVVMIGGLISQFVKAGKSKKRLADLKDEGLITGVEKEGLYREGEKQWLRQGSLFQTRIAKLSEVFQVINWELLKGQNISWEDHKGYIVFKVGRVNDKGTLVSILQTQVSTNVPGAFEYLYKNMSWTEANIVFRDDLIGGDLILTEITRAFLQLDPQTTITRVLGDEYKTTKTFGI